MYKLLDIRGHPHHLSAIQHALTHSHTLHSNTLRMSASKGDLFTVEDCRSSLILFLVLPFVHDR